MTYTTHTCCTSSIHLSRSVHIAVGVRTKNSMWPTSNPTNYLVGQWLLGPFSLCSHSIWKALINFLKCTLRPYNGAQSTAIQPSPGGEKERHFQGSLAVEVVMARALTTNMVKSYHLNISRPWSIRPQTYSPTVALQQWPDGRVNILPLQTSKQVRILQERRCTCQSSPTKPIVALGSAAVVRVVNEAVSTTPPVCDEAS